MLFRSLYGACRRSLVTGPLLLLRYVAEDAPWAALAGADAACEAAGVVARMLTAAEAVVAVGMPP